MAVKRTDLGTWTTPTPKGPLSFSEQIVAIAAGIILTIGLVYGVVILVQASACAPQARDFVIEAKQACRVQGGDWVIAYDVGGRITGYQCQEPPFEAEKR